MGQSNAEPNGDAIPKIHLLGQKKQSEAHGSFKDNVATSVPAADSGNIDADMDLSMEDREKPADRKQRKKKTKINPPKVYYEGPMCELYLI